MNRRTAIALAAAAIGAGSLVAIGLAPLRWWPLALVGVIISQAIAERWFPRARFLPGFLFALGWFAPATGWMWFLTAPGWIVAVLFFASLHGAATTMASFVTARSARIVVRACAHALAEAVRFSFPFGGVPIASLAIAASPTPGGQLVRLVGPLGVSAWVLLVAALLVIGVRRSRAARISLVALLLLVPVARLVPGARDSGDSLRIALVQGGGPQAVLAIDSNPRDVVDRHLLATDTLSPSDDVDVVVWPENVIDVRTFAGSELAAEIAAQAKRLDATFLVGVTESVPNGFTNAQVVITPGGEIVDRYDKVRRVPYGEYIPLRGLLSAVGAPVGRVPRDAVAGDGTAAVRVGEHVLAVVISWETFFAGRANEGIEAGGSVLVNPTNGSSYTGTLLQEQQLDVSRLRARETDRYTLQVATTGITALISPDGDVIRRTSIGEQVAFVADVPLRTGRTVYSHTGDAVLIIALLGGAIAMALMPRARGLRNR
jgi:apolipoprotein N-acyltransferase